MSSANKLTFFCTALAIVCLPHIASAHDIGLSKQHDACIDKSGETTAGMINCIAVEAGRQDAQLNKAYKALMAELAPPRKTQLQEAQRAWIRYRDTNCAFYHDPDGGSMARVSANHCVMTATAERARELESLRQ